MYFCILQLKKVIKSEPQKNITKPKGGKKGTKAPSTNANNKSEAAKARDEARRKMLEERKRQMKAKQQQNAENAENADFNFVQF